MFERGAPCHVEVPPPQLRSDSGRDEAFALDGRRSLSAATDGTPPTMEYKASSRGAGDWADYLHRGPVGVDTGLVEEIAGESVEGRTSKRDLAVQQWESPMR